MSYKLSKREKRLLYILLILVMVLVGWFFIIEPSLTEYNEKTLEIGEKRVALNGLKNTYSDYVNAPEKALEESAKFISNKENFNEMMINEDIDQMMTRMALLYGLQPISLNISEPTPIDLVAYTDSLSDEDKPSDLSDRKVEINKVEVSMNLGGEIFNAFALADSIKDSTSIRLKDYSYVRAETVAESTMILVFDIYMINE